MLLCVAERCNGAESCFEYACITFSSIGQFHFLKQLAVVRSINSFRHFEHSMFIYTNSRCTVLKICEKIEVDWNTLKFRLNWRKEALKRVLSSFWVQYLHFESKWNVRGKNQRAVRLCNPKKTLQELSLQKDEPWLSRNCFFGLSQLQTCLSRLRDITMHPRLITDDNVSQGIAPLCSISCQKSFAYDKTVCFLIFRQEARNPPCPHFSVTQIIWNDWSSTPSNFPCCKAAVSFNHLTNRKNIHRTGACPQSSMHGSHFALAMGNLFVSRRFGSSKAFFSEPCS